MRDITYRVLETDADFIGAALLQIRVYVVLVPEDNLPSIVDYGGPIEKVTPNFVRIAGTYYLRSDCYEFRFHISSNSK